MLPNHPVRSRPAFRILHELCYKHVPCPRKLQPISIAAAILALTIHARRALSPSILRNPDISGPPPKNRIPSPRIILLTHYTTTSLTRPWHYWPVHKALDTRGDSLRHTNTAACALEIEGLYHQRSRQLSATRRIVPEAKSHPPSMSTLPICGTASMSLSLTRQSAPDAPLSCCPRSLSRVMHHIERDRLPV